MLASIQPASLNHNKGNMGIGVDSEKDGNALKRVAANRIRDFGFV
jgi:hypothetical protein